MGQYNCHEYMQKVERFLGKEEDNSNSFLQPESKYRIIDIVLRESIKNHAEALTQKPSGCTMMFQEREIHKLKLIYKIFSKVDKTLTFIIRKMSPYIKAEGSKIVENEDNLKDPIKFTTKLLQFKKEIDVLIETAFADDMRF